MMVYTGANVLNKGVAFLLLPVMTAYLTAEDYGIISTLSVFMAALAPLIYLGVPTTIGIDFFKRDEEKRSENISSLIMIPVFTTIAVLFVVLLFDDYIADKFRVPKNWVLIVPFFTLFMFIPQVVGILYRSRKEPYKYVTYMVSQSSINVLLSLLFVVYLGYGWQGRMYGIAITGMVMMLVGITLLAKMGYLVPRINAHEIKAAVKFGTGLIPHSLGNQAISLADRLFIVSLLGLKQAGLYAVAVQISSIMMIALTAFSQAWTPHLFSQLKNADENAKHKIVRESYLVMLMFFALFALLNMALVPVLFMGFVNEKFSESMNYVFWITLGHAFRGLYMTVANYAFYEKRSGIVSSITTFNVVIYLGLSYALINYYGTIGAAYAYAIISAIVFMVTWFFSNKIYPMPWLLAINNFAKDRKMP